MRCRPPAGVGSEMTIGHGTSASMISEYQPIRDDTVYMVAVDDRHITMIAAQMGITVRLFRHRYLTFDRDTRKWSLRVTGAYIKGRLARTDAAQLRSLGGTDMRTVEEREDEEWDAQCHKPVIH